MSAFSDRSISSTIVASHERPDSTDDCTRLPSLSNEGLAVSPVLGPRCADSLDSPPAGDLCSSWLRGNDISAAERDKAAAHPLGSEAPAGGACLHEIKYDARQDRRRPGYAAELLAGSGRSSRVRDHSLTARCIDRMTNRRHHRGQPRPVGKLARDLLRPNNRRP